MKMLLFRAQLIVFIVLGCVFTASGQEPLLPQISGWQLFQDDPVYDANNLWNAINGAADLYLEYSFVDLHIGRYINKDSVEVKVELYRHNSEPDAFGIYSQERDPEYHFIPVGVQGYLQKGVLNFLSGSYYIKLSTYQTRDQAQKEMLSIAGQVNAHLKQPNAMPKIFQLFPVAGKQNNTEQYIAQNFLGYSILKSFYCVTYEVGTPFIVFMSEKINQACADSVLQEYLKFIPKENVTKSAKDTYEIQDTHHGLIAVRIQKNVLFGILSCKNREVREKYLKEVSTRLSHQRF